MLDTDSEERGLVKMLTTMCVRGNADGVSDKKKSSSLSSLSTSLPMQPLSSKDTILPSSSSSSSSSKKKPRGFKMVVGSSKKQSVKDKESHQSSSRKEKEEVHRVPPPMAPPKVEDDEDGHLIYKKGDYLDSRCK